MRKLVRGNETVARRAAQPCVGTLEGPEEPAKYQAHSLVTPMPMKWTVHLVGWGCKIKCKLQNI